MRSPARAAAARGRPVATLCGQARGQPRNALAATAAYFKRVGPTRASWSPRSAYLALDMELLVVHSRDDENNAALDTDEVIQHIPRAQLELVDGLTHRRTARDPTVINLVADFVAG
jgi:hypothetical protein